MKNPSSVIAELTATDSKTAKQEILQREAAAGNTDLFKGLRLCYDNMVTFGVKKVPFKSQNHPPSIGLKASMFFGICDKLAARELTGDAAQQAIEGMMSLATIGEWNGWYRLILIKDMKAGFSESTINKACAKKFPQYVIPVFEMQLAKDCTDDEGNVDESLFHGKKQIDTKLDGMRVATIVYPNGHVEQFSRNGKELLNFGVIKAQIASVASSFWEPMVLDGEVMSASFQDLMKQARRKSDVQADDSVLNLFDVLSLKEFLAGKGVHTQTVRSKALQSWYESHCSFMPNVNVLGNEIVDLDTLAGQKRLGEINKIALAGKYEGIMLKDPDAVYECKRSLNWMKMKPFIEVSLEVLDVEEGKTDSKFVGTMGALVCGGVDDGKKINVNVGSGFSIQQRAQIWADHTEKPVSWQKKVGGKWVTMTEKPSGKKVVGQIVEIKADALTKAQDSDTWSLRFPRFKVWRGFVKGEKL